MSIKKLVNKTYLDIKKLSEENPNDMDLGKLIRAYIRQQEEMNSEWDELKNDDLDTPLTTWGL
jgi:hypothetical protein